MVCLLNGHALPANPHVLFIILVYRCMCGHCQPMPTPRESICCQEIDQILDLLVEDPKIVETASALRHFCAGIPISSQNRMLSFMKHLGSKCLEQRNDNKVGPSQLLFWHLTALTHCFHTGSSWGEIYEGCM